MGVFGKDGFVGHTFAAYDPRGRSAGGKLRVLVMLLTVLVRTIHVCIYIARSAIRSRHASLIVGCIFGVLGTIAVLFSIAQIGAARGKRRALGVNWGRWHLDIVLALIFAISAVLFVLSLVISGRFGHNDLFIGWCVTWVLIAIFAWIAGKPEESYV